MSRPELVTVFGGTGFVGRYVVRQLVEKGYRVRVAVRRPDLAQHLFTMGSVGQLQAVQANVRFPSSVEAAVKDADHVINLVGILFATGAQTFETVVDEGAETIAKAAKAEGISKIVQLSAIGADSESASLYGRSKAYAEEKILKLLPDSIIIRPSIVFGAEDEFFNRFGQMATMMPAIPLVGAETKFQPVYVDDVASVVTKAIEGNLKPGNVYELGGPQIASFHELISMMLDEIGRKRIVVPLSLSMGKIMAKFLQYAPASMKLTPDQVVLLGNDNVVSDLAIEEGRNLEGLGIQPKLLENILPDYLVQYKRSGEFAKHAPKEE